MFAQEANMHENKFNTYRVPSGLLILFLEKALTLIHMEAHLNEVSVLVVAVYRSHWLFRGPPTAL